MVKLTGRTVLVASVLTLTTSSQVLLPLHESNELLLRTWPLLM